MRLTWTESVEVFEAPVILATPVTLTEGLALIVEQIDVLAKGRKLDGVILGTSRKVWLAPSEVEGVKNFESEINRVLGVPIRIENDAALGALGEATNGAGQGYKIVVYYTISTGVGGARVVEGKIDKAAYGFEPGQQIIGANQTLEDYISGQAVEKRFGQKPFEVVDNEFWQETASFLARGLANSILHWSPEVIVLGGSMMKVPGIVIGEVTTALPSFLPSFLPAPKIVLGILGEVAGLHGALALLRETYQH